jgi:hypothetical protein
MAVAILKVLKVLPESTTIICANGIIFFYKDGTLTSSFLTETITVIKILFNVSCF